MLDSRTCSRCGMTSYNPIDIRERYCGNCHQFDTPNMDELFDMLGQTQEEDTDG